MTFLWGPEQKAAYTHLFEALLSALLLQFHYLKEMFYIKTNTIQVGIGAALTQEVEPDTQLPVAFASRRLKPAESCYSTTDQEGLEVVWPWGTLNHKSWVCRSLFSRTTQLSERQLKRRILEVGYSSGPRSFQSMIMTSSLSRALKKSCLNFSCAPSWCKTFNSQTLTGTT